ncbi:putative ribonuclease H-like domain-containing protein [Tanacetum coccineum]
MALSLRSYESDSEDEYVSIPTKETRTPSFANQQVKTPRETVKNQFTHSQKPKVDKKELGYGFTVKACFVCGSLNHLIRDCDFHEKRMARKAELNNGWNRKSSQREIRKTWNNVQRVNKQNQFVPSAILTKTGKILVNTARASGTKNVSTARQSFNRQAVLTSTAMKVNTLVLLGEKGKLLLSPQQVVIGDHKDTTGTISPNTMVDPVLEIVTLLKIHLADSSPNRHMTGNKAYLAEFQDFNGGLVAFRGSKGYITGKGKGPTWLFDLDYLTDSMNYQPVRLKNQANKHAGPQEANHNVGTEDIIDAGDSEKEDESAQDCFTDAKREGLREEEQVFLDELKRLKRQEKDANKTVEALKKEFAQETKNLIIQAGAAKASSTNIFSNVSTPAKASSTNLVNTVSTSVSTASLIMDYLSLIQHSEQDDSEIPPLEDIYQNSTDGIFTNSSYDDEGAVADFTNLETVVNVSPIPTSRIISSHPSALILGDPTLAVQTRSKVNKSSGAHAFVSYVQKQRRNNHKDFQHCLFACFLSQNEPKKISEALEDESWVDAMQEELLQFKIQKVWILVDLPFGKKAIGTKWVYRNKKDERGVVVRNKARLVAQGHRQEEGLTKWLKALYGLTPSSSEPVQVYVDDIIFGSTKKSWCDEFEALMKSRFQMSSMGELTFFLGLQTASTPIMNQKPLVKDEEASDVDVHLYRSMIGSLMYLTASRPDIMFAVCACSRFQVTPKSSHLSVVKRIFRYLKGKPKLGLWYPRVSSFDLESYSDSDYAGANLDRKSTTGGCQFLGRRLISWQCKKQTIVATSTTKAEYVAAASCCGQNPVYHSKTKHIAIRHHFIRDAYEKKLIQVLKIHTDDNVADLLTKAFDVSRESLRRVFDGTEALLLPTLFILWLATVSTDSAKLVPLGKVCTAIETLKKNTAKALISLSTTITLSNTMVVLESCPKHNMVAYLEKTEGNAEFHEIIDFLRELVPFIMLSLHITAKVAGKSVSISEASIRSDLLFDDADGIDSLTNQAIFDAIQLMGHLDAKKKFVMYPRFISIFLGKQLDNVSVPLDHFPVNTLTSKVFSFMVKKGKHFSGKVTPLFATMLVQPTQDEGVSSERPSEAQPTPSPVPTSEVPYEPQTDSSPAQTSEVPTEHQSNLSPRPSPPTNIPGSIPESSGENLGGHSSSDKSLSGNEDEMTIQSITKLKKQAKPVIKHHRAYLKSVSVKQRFPRKSFSKKHKVHKESVSKQGRKFAKGESSVQRDPLFDEMPEDTVDHMDTENAQDEGRTREIVDEDKEIEENALSTEEVLSTDKEGVSTDIEKVSTDRPIVSTDGSKVSTDKQIEGTEEHNEGTEEKNEGTEEHIEGTEEQVESTDGHKKGTEEEITTQATQTSTQTPTSMIFGDDETIAKVLLNMSQAKAVSKEKEKGVELKDVEETERPRPTSTRSLLTLKPLPKIDPKDKGKLKRRMNLKFQEQEREQFTIEERAKFLHDTIAAQRKFLAQQRSKAIRNRPPTKSQLRNQMMTYLNHVGNFKHAELKIKKFEEVQALYEKIKRSDEDFISIRSVEDERLIKRMNEKGVDSSKYEIIKEQCKEEVKNGDESRSSGDDSDKENDELRLHLTIAPDEEKEVDYEILDRKYPIKEWKTECLGTKPQTNQAEHIEEINQNVVIKNDMPEGFQRVLWGDLIVLFKPDDKDEFWNSQLDWSIVSWKFHSSSGVHTLVTETGLVIHMLVEKKYSLRKEVLMQMLKLKLESEEDSTMALELIKFVKKILVELEPEG